MSADNMIHLNDDPTGENYQRPDPATTAGPAIDDELAGDLHGPGQTSRNGPATVNIKGQVKGGRSLSKRGKKAIVFGGAGVAALILGGVMMAGHHGERSSSSPSVELAGAGNAPRLKARPNPLSSAVAATLSAHGAAGAQHPVGNTAASALTTAATTGAAKKPPMTPRQKYEKWLETQHYKDLEGQHLAGQAALVSTGNWMAAKTPTTLPVSATTGYPAPRPSVAGGIPAGYLQGAPGGTQQSLHGAAANEAFVRAQRNKKEKDQGYLTAHLHAPVSHSELFSGSVIPAVLVTGINSQLPGEITAQVRQNIYNSLNPGEVVIPQGSKLIGVYDSGVQYGQSRVLVAWSRVIYPNGETVDLRGMSGTNGLGEAGFSQITDNHYWKIFGSAFLISLLGAAAQLAQPQQSSALANPGMGQTATGAIAQEMDSVGGDMLQKNLSIAPTLKIRPGYLFNVLVSKTMILPVYHP
ncbi:TrbI/VirB10 family protein [Acidithiobacillus ferrooxidans]|uniref:TrbI/VirB10 family protein n=1 Tax=Acidithiobacillus ferrooxidans TaxID=920 RepID=UPI00214C474B|nr:TrbI/VirB10 family protein [Acidithiobacillus ferrooxidans]MCR2831432.1 TrbI/VirB10 family protein [Acidithiobacillus ferrooxidans]